MKFQIKKLILWPKNGQYPYKVIDFKLNTVNVITGDSRTGKSAIIPIIDYCLASSKCYIPTQTIRSACSWFGIVIKLDKGQLLLARKEPGKKKSTSEMMMIQNFEIKIPDIPEKNTTCDAVKHFLDEYSKISFLKIENNFYDNRPSFRDMMSFCFQPQNVVANANILFYRTDKMENRNKLISIFPYILGVVTPELLASQQELINLKKTLKRKEKELQKLSELSTKWESEIQSWTSMAIELGLLDEICRNLSFNSQLEVLQKLVKENTEEKRINADNILQASKEIVELREEENKISMELTTYKRRYIEMTNLMSTVSNYRNELSIQVERLNITEWLNKKAKKNKLCPLCQQKLSDDGLRNFYLKRLEETKMRKKEVEAIPASFEREYVIVKEKIEYLSNKLADVQKRIRIEENKKQNDSRYTLEGISRILGKIEYAIETVKTMSTDGELQKEIDKLSRKIKNLEIIVSEEAIKIRIKNVINKISIYQMELVKMMDVECPNDQFRLDYKNLTVQVDRKDGRQDYLWEIGSGSNWLAYHISTLLGLQKYFSTITSVVPNFVIFDQPSQVYFPYDSNTNNDKKILKDTDKEAVKSLFDTMAKCISTIGNLQIIVLEHADSSIYGDISGINEVCVWHDNEKLIPLEWIK